MPTVLLGILVLLLILWAMNAFARADPRAVVRFAKVSGGTVALAGAATLAATGRVALAVPLGIAGLTLLGLWPGSSIFGRRSRSGGQTSRVRSAFLEMELDHDSGAMRGVILAGPREGTRLESLDVATLTAMMNEIDDESRALLAAYLDRRDAGWREHAQADAGAGRGGASRGPMTHEEAYQILGLPPGAKAEEIVRAHRTLMKKLHPDQGGTNYLAARVNEAKDTLLRMPR